MAHTHSNSLITSASSTHGHNTAASGVTDCPASGVYYHSHYQATASGGGHTHDFTLSYGSAGLGSPNWWEHTHTVTLVTESSAGPSHNHTISLYGDGCAKSVSGYYCAEEPHTHANTYSVASGSFAHSSHTISGSTGNADPAGTPAVHVHSVSINSGSISASHTHSVSGAITTNRCYFTATKHGHTAVATTGDDLNHWHSVSGNSGSGGEAAGGPTGVKTINDTAIASVKTMKDTAIASVKTINDAS